MLTISAVAAVAFYGTRAFFSDTETSTGNTFTAGAIDLEVSNSSWYNFDEETGAYGSMVQVDRSTWQMSNLDDQLFFSYADVKPGDLGEDTVGLKVTNNPAWVCVDIDLTANDDVTCNDPEKDDDPNCAAPGLGMGELAGQLNFFFWADDGDNVYEDGEKPLAEGPASSILNGVTWALADSNTNVWDGTGPIQPFDAQGAPKTYYIGKAWCMGTLTKAPVVQGNNSPASDPGVRCDGKPVNNAAQTDMMKGDITFRATQQRHQEDYVCKRPIKTIAYNNWPANQTGYGTKKWEAEGRMGDYSPTNGATTWEVGVGLNTQSASQSNNQFGSDFDWPDAAPVDFSLKYDQTTGLATFTVAGAPVQTYNVGIGIGSKLWLAVKGSTTNIGTVGSLDLNGTTLPDVLSSTGGIPSSVQFTGLDTSSGFELKGKVTFDHIAGAKNSDLVLKVEISQ